MKLSSVVADRIEQTRRICLDALGREDLAAAAGFLAGRGLDVDRCVELLRVTAERQLAAPELLEARQAALSSGAARPAAMERALLLQAALRVIDRVPDLPVHDSVKKLFCTEFQSYACPPPGTEERFAMTRYWFTAMARIAFLMRFPGGVLHWERSGFPRSWLGRVPGRYLARTLRFLAFDARAFKPYLVSHIGGLVKRYPLLIERDVRRSFYRMAAVAERQPDIKAIMTASWLISKETYRVSPHLKFLAGMFLEAGGIYTEAGKAQDMDGFLAGDETRKALYETGQYRPTIGVVICTRQQAIGWLRANSDLEAQLDVK